MRTTRPVIAALLSAIAFNCLACGPTYHRPPSYRYRPERARAVEMRAEQACIARGEPAGTPTRHFVTDGCSWWIDSVWQECCVTHDIDYWCGGTAEDRKLADGEFRHCVAARYPGWRGSFLSRMMEIGVRMGGIPYLPTYYRWGYGHVWPSGYTGADEPAP